jgi:hypothetical protein
VEEIEEFKEHVIPEEILSEKVKEIPNSEGNMNKEFYFPKRIMKT